ncbi:MAG: DinB family protein [bacterium]
MTENPGAPARSLFPEYPRIPSMYADEVEGLPEDLLDRRRPEKGWGRWTVREQVSHVASVFYRWILLRWAPVLFGENLPRDKSLADTGGAERMLDPARFHAMEDLLEALRDGADLVWEVLGAETAASLREKEISDRIDPQARRPPAGESVREWREKVTLKAHTSGIRIAADDPDLYYYTLEFTVRHMLWEAYAHLKTIQMHKAAEGLPARVEIPEVGYNKILAWD